MRAENVCKPLSIKGNVEKVLSERKEKKMRINRVTRINTPRTETRFSLEH